MEYEVKDIEAWVERGEVAFNPDVVKSLLNEIYRLRASSMQLFLRVQQLERYEPQAPAIQAWDNGDQA